MPKRFIAFVLFIGTASVLVAAELWSRTSAATLPWGGLVAFISVGLLAQLAAIGFGEGKSHSSSIAFLPFLASILLFEPVVATLIVFVVVTIGELVQRRKKPAHVIFNVAQAVLTIAFAAKVYVAISGAAGVTVNISAFAAASCVFFGTNMALASFGIALSRRMALGPTFRQVVGPMGANLLYDVLASPIAVLVAWLYTDNNVIGLLIVVFPLLLIRHSYSSRLKLEQANLDLLEVLVKAIETRDPYTSGHSRRVATLSTAIATEMGLSARTVTVIGRAALLHDIGKIDAAYAAVIRKPHDLTPYERELIRTHAARGADLLETIASVEKRVVTAVRHHHERYDGTGYPAGLRAKEIPLASRIIMLCDSVDAMLSDRPYRKALPMSTVRAELQKNAGTQFDPDIVGVILSRTTLEKAAGLVAPAAEASDGYSATERLAAYA